MNKMFLLVNAELNTLQTCEEIFVISFLVIEIRVLIKNHIE